MRTAHLRRAVLFSVTILVAGTWPAHAGDLDPPAGPIGPTMKTLTEVEPRIAINAANTPGDADSLFKITQPGSYYLSENVTGAIGKHGIEIVASGVTLDLNGFDLIGVPGMGALDGVSATMAGLSNITVVNGSIRGWGGEGVDLRTPSLSTNCRVERVHASDNDGSGITVYGGSRVTDCSVSTNALHGIFTDYGCTVTRCAANSNTGSGIRTAFDCTIADCAASFNAVNGFFTSSGCTITNGSASHNGSNGILTGDGCTLIACAATSNTGAGGGSGINTGASCALSHCAAKSNTGAGIAVGSAGTVIGCSTFGNTGNGVIAAAGTMLSHCTASANATGFNINVGCTISNCSAYQNTGSGFLTGDGCTVTGCSALSNAEHGISVNSGSTVADCTARNNPVGATDSYSGISGISACVIRGNTCSNSIQAGAQWGNGVSVSGYGNRIEGNNCVLFNHGLRVTGANNIITKNTVWVGTYTPWEIAANNVAGPMVDRRAPGTPFLNGFTAPSSLDSTDPNANFAY